jgi:uronate dehydrogenase
MTTVLITGGAGKIATTLRERLRGKYTLRLTDLVTPPNLTADESFVAADLADPAAVTRAVEGVDAIIHLGGISKEDSWEKILPANLVGTYNVFEAARQAGVKRIVFASSNHAVGYYRRADTVDHASLPKPDGRYGLSKVFGEAIGSLYADKYGLEVFAVRIGAMTPEPVDVRRLAIWVHPDDLAALVDLGLSLPGLRFEIVYGMSENKRTWWDNNNALRLGYRPKHRSEDYAAAVHAREPPQDPNDRTQVFQGGAYVTAEFIADPTSITGR